MARIKWEEHQRTYIEPVHHVFEDEFNHAWRGRDPEDDEVRPDGRMEGYGVTSAGRGIVMVWELDENGDVFPITAFDPKPLRYSGQEVEAHEVEPEEQRSKEKRRKRRKRPKPRGETRGPEKDDRR